jgi:hypothetical protein
LVNDYHAPISPCIGWIAESCKRLISATTSVALINQFVPRPAAEATTTAGYEPTTEARVMPSYFGSLFLKLRFVPELVKFILRYFSLIQNFKLNSVVKLLRELLTAVKIRLYYFGFQVFS